MREEREGEGPKSRPHFQHNVVGRETCSANDALNGVRIGDEVLTPLLGWANLHFRGQRADVAAAEQARHYQSPKARSVFAVSWPHMSSSLVPRSTAMPRTVKGMSHDALGLPRCGTGVR